MKEHISRADLMQKLTAAEEQKKIKSMTGDEAYNEFLTMVNAVADKTAKWKIRMNEKTCTMCGFIYYSNGDLWNYCPNCGTPMEGKTR